MIYSIIYIVLWTLWETDNSILNTPCYYTTFIFIQHQIKGNIEVKIQFKKFIKNNK